MKRRPYTLGGDAARDGWVLSPALPGGWANLLAIAKLWYLGGGTERHGPGLGRSPESKTNQPESFIFCRNPRSRMQSHFIGNGWL